MQKYISACGLCKGAKVDTSVLGGGHDAVARGACWRRRGGKEAKTNSKGDRMIGWVIHSQVTGDGHRSREFRFQPFGIQPREPGAGG